MEAVFWKRSNVTDIVSYQEIGHPKNSEMTSLLISILYLARSYIYILYMYNLS